MLDVREAESNTFGRQARCEREFFNVCEHANGTLAANTFAKAGIMLRNGLDAGAAAIVLDVRPGVDIEFRSRTQQNDSMQFLGTAHVTFPVWLQLDWQFRSQTTKTVVASYSEDHQNWQPVGAPLTWTMKDFFLTGIVVTSHGVSLLFHGAWDDDIGNSGIIGDTSLDLTDNIDFVTTVDAARRGTTIRLIKNC